jgi:hypothetical protein
MIFEDRMNLDNWTNEVMSDGDGETFDPNDRSGDVDWVQTGDTSQFHGRIQNTQAFASPQQSYFDSIQAASENRFGIHAPHFPGGSNVGIGVADGVMEGLHPGHPGIEHDSKPSARIGGGDPMHRLQSPVVAKGSDGKRHSISNDPFNSQLSLSYSMGDDQGTPSGETRARLTHDDDLAGDAKYSHSDALPSWPVSFNPNLVPGHSTVYPIAAPAVPTYYTFDDIHLARFPPPVASEQATVMPSPVVVPKKPPTLSKRRSKRSKSKTTAVPLAPAAAAAAPARTQTQSGERTSPARRGPTKGEIAEASTERGAAALQVWYSRLNDLWDYKKINGDCLVPQKYTPNPSLGIWVNKQRMEKKALDERRKSSMTDGKEQALEEVGFVWAKRKGQASWDEKYRDLRRYCQRNGDCNVPTKYNNNPALGRWVSTQRSQYKQFQRDFPTHMNAERHSKLTKLGFKWNMME